MKILDIGCGPGHLHLIGRYFGHDVFGFDVPLPDGHIFNELCRFFRADKSSHRVESRQPLPVFPDRFDLAAAVLINIGPWDGDQWRFFVEDVCDNVLTDEGALYLVFTSGSRTDSAWEYVERIADWTHSDRQAFIRKMHPRQTQTAS